LLANEFDQSGGDQLAALATALPTATRAKPPDLRRTRVILALKAVDVDEELFWSSLPGKREWT
jgi:hypothetical protein